MSEIQIKNFEEKFIKNKYPEIKAGQTIEVDTIIRDKDKQRVQKFKGLVIKVKGSKTNLSFTVRKISYGVGVEKTFPINTPNITKIKVLKYEPVRRAKLYFMRERVGKSAMRIRKGRSIMVPQEGTSRIEEAVEESVSE